MWRVHPFVLFLFFVPGADAGAEEPPTQLRASRFAIATGDALASEAGAEMLRAGGNATDAAVAATLVLGVVNPWASGIGGGGFALVHDAARGSTTFLDFREVAPAGATADMFVRDGRAVPELSQRGGLAVAVPGEVAGLAELSRRHGRLGLARAAAPAIRLASGGFPVRERAPEVLRAAAPLDDGIRGVFFLGETPAAPGTRVRNPALAATLRAIARRGPSAFYRGPIARAIVRRARAAGGILTEADLDGYRVRERRPLRGRYRGLGVVTAPLPSSGGVAVLEALAVLERHDLRAMGTGSADHLHLVAEALKPAFADRAAHLGDTDGAASAAERLLDPARLSRRAALVRMDRAAPASTWTENGAPPRDGGTTHVSVVDSEGNAVALTSTVNREFGARLVAGDTGIVLNDEMDDFTAQPGTPNAFGLLQSAENAVGPGKRPLSSMVPTIVFGPGGRPLLVVGAAGGPHIISATLQVLVAVVDFGADAGSAVELPRVHHQWMPDVLLLEPGVPPDVCRVLSERGHRIRRATRIGVAQAVVVRSEGGRTVSLEAASDGRRGGAPAGE